MLCLPWGSMFELAATFFTLCDNRSARQRVARSVDAGLQPSRRRRPKVRLCRVLVACRPVVCLLPHALCEQTVRSSCPAVTLMPLQRRVRPLFATSSWCAYDPRSQLLFVQRRVRCRYSDEFAVVLATSSLPLRAPRGAYYTILLRFAFIIVVDIVLVNVDLLFVVRPLFVFARSPLISLLCISRDRRRHQCRDYHYVICRLRNPVTRHRPVPPSTAAAVPPFTCVSSTSSPQLLQSLPPPIHRPTAAHVPIGNQCIIIVAIIARIIIIINYY